MAGRLQEQFLAIRSTAEPVRAKLGIPAMRRPPGQARCAALLPLPLYIAYVQLAAAQEAFDLPADVSIAGERTCNRPRWMCRAPHETSSTRRN